MQIDVYSDGPDRSAEETFDQLREEWNELLHQSAFDTVFMTYEWQHLWWEHFGPQAEGALFLVAARDADGQLAGLWPLYDGTPGETPRRLRIIGSPRGSDYLDFIARAGQEREVYEAILDFAAGQEDWCSIEAINVPVGSPTLEILAPLAEERGFDVRIEPATVCPGIGLPPSWEEYLSRLDGRQRHEIRRKLRRAEHGMDKVEWYLSDDPATLAQDVNTYLDLFQKSSYIKEEYLDEQRQKFFQALAPVMLEAGWLYLALLTINEDKVASMFCFDYGEAISVYNSGFDPQQYSHLSSGIVLLCYCIQDAIAKKYPLLDFLRGDEEYKYRFGAEDRVIYRLTIQRG